MSGLWRLIHHGAGSPDWNMAVDRALLDTAVESEAIPTLRLFWWNPHALSLGANQNADGVIDWTALTTDGYGVVRRPTGGRAILHAEELTYSVVAPAPPGGITAAYRWLADGLRGGLAEAGITVDLERMHTSRDTGNRAERQGSALETRHPCFSTAGRYELMAGGRKLVGSAQYRNGGWLMQHGSILLGSEHVNLPRYLIGADVDVEIARLQRATVDCTTLLGYDLPASDLAPMFAAGFARALGISLEEDRMSGEELERVDRLRTGQFGTVEWTRFGRRRNATDKETAD